MMEMNDSGEIDHKVLAVDLASKMFAAVRGIDSLPKSVKADLRNLAESRLAYAQKCPTKK